MCHSDSKLLVTYYFLIVLRKMTQIYKVEKAQNDVLLCLLPKQIVIEYNKQCVKSIIMSIHIT